MGTPVHCSACIASTGWCLATSLRDRDLPAHNDTQHSRQNVGISHVALGDLLARAEMSLLLSFRSLFISADFVLRSVSASLSALCCAQRSAKFSLVSTNARLRPSGNVSRISSHPSSCGNSNTSKSASSSSPWEERPPFVPGVRVKRFGRPALICASALCWSDKRR